MGERSRIPNARSEPGVVTVLLGAVANRALQARPPLRVRFGGGQRAIVQVRVDQELLSRLPHASRSIRRTRGGAGLTRDGARVTRGKSTARRWRDADR